MAQESFKVVESTTVYNSKDMATNLSKLDNLSNPYRGADRCPYKTGQKCGEFLGFVPMLWSTSETNKGTYIALKFKDLPPVAVKSFLKTSEEALDENNKEYHIENEDEGAAHILNQHTDLDEALFKELEKFFKSERTFKITPFKVKTPWGKKSRHLINII